MKALLVVSLVATAGFLGVSSAHASGWDELSYFTFHRQVELPGVVLQPGTYMFKKPDMDGASQIVQVFSRDGSKIYGTFMTVETTEPTTQADPVVRLENKENGAPMPILDWAYPGKGYGHEFMYRNGHAEPTHASILQHGTMALPAGNN